MVLEEVLEVLVVEVDEVFVVVLELEDWDEVVEVVVVLEEEFVVLYVFFERLYYMGMLVE